MSIDCGDVVLQVLELDRNIQVQFFDILQYFNMYVCIFNSKNEMISDSILCSWVHVIGRHFTQ
jgi:hypothetical protein